MKKTTPQAKGMTAKQTTANQAGRSGLSFAELRQLADKGDAAAQAKISHLLDLHPGIWRRVGDLGKHAELSFVRMIAENDFVLGESVKRRAAEMRNELAGVFPSAAELLAVQRVVASWLYLQHVESQCARAEQDAATAKLWLIRQQQASRIYLGAMKSLVLVRQLLPAATEPAALAANGTATAKLNGKGRLPVAANGDGHSLVQVPAGPVNRINGVTKSNKPKALATA